jgi:hypothetical protein
MMICEVVSAVALHLKAVVGGLKTPPTALKGLHHIKLAIHLEYPL